MLITAAQWNMRLENEYKAMQAFPFNSLFSWKTAGGQNAPRVTAYVVTYSGKTVVAGDGGSEVRNQKTEVTITMPSSPGGSPAAAVTGGSIPFLPNVYKTGEICLGSMWYKDPILWKLVVNIGKLLAADPSVTDLNSPANEYARDDWIRRQRGGTRSYPCGNVDFPHPVGY